MTPEPAERDTIRPAASGQRRERGIEVEEIHPGHIDYRDGQGRAFHVWTVTTVSKHGLGVLSAAQLRELGRQISQLLEPAAAGPEEDREPGRTGNRAEASD